MANSCCRKLDVLRVANLPTTITTAQLYTLFARHGEVYTIGLVPDKDAGSAFCCGWVYMPQARMAIEALNEAEVDGRRLEVRFMGVLLPRLKPLAA